MDAYSDWNIGGNDVKCKIYSGQSGVFMIIKKHKKGWFVVIWLLVVKCDWRRFIYNDFELLMFNLCCLLVQEWSLLQMIRWIVSLNTNFKIQSLHLYITDFYQLWKKNTQRSLGLTLIVMNSAENV